MKDGSGGGGHVHKRSDPEKFFPTKVRITVVQVSGGAKYDPALVPNLPAKAGDAGATTAQRPPREIPPGDSLRERFLKLIDRPRVPLNAVEHEAATSDGLREVAFHFDSEAGQRVPGLLVAPADAAAPPPVVIALHGTGGSKQAMRPLLRRIAARGLIGVAIDARFAGERSGGAKGSEAYRAAILETWKTGRGFPFLYDTVWDVSRLMDYLQTRRDVDARRIGAIGFSKGGMELYLAAAVDERLAAAVPCIGVQSFGWALEHDAWRSRVSTIQTAVDAAAAEVGVSAIDAAFIRRFYDRVAPGVHREFDGPAMVPLIAPRPLLVINGDWDDRTPLAGLQLCVDAARQEYAKLGAQDRFEFRLQPDTRHAVTPESERYAIDWLLQQLSK
jgi:dienelactone hydrolase